MVPGAVLERHQCLSKEGVIYFLQHTSDSCSEHSHTEADCNFSHLVFLCFRRTVKFMVYLIRLSVYQTVISLMCVSQYISTEGHNCFILAMNIIEFSIQYHPMNKNIYDVSVSHIGENVCKYFLQHNCHCICI